MQSLKVRDLGVTFDFNDHITAICRNIFFIRNIGKIRYLLLYNACSTMIHQLFIVD